jgi:hypothetical protein
MAKVPYTKPLVAVMRPRLTLEEFRKNFEMYLERDPEFREAVIMDAQMIDDPGSEHDGAVIFECCLPEEGTYGQFVVPVLSSSNPQ